MGNQLISTMKFVTGLNPLNTTGAAANSDYVSMENYHHATFILQFGVALTATPAITFTQAKDVTDSGGDAKALPFEIMHVNAATGTNDTLVSTVVTSDTIDKAAGSQQLFVAEFDSDDLDVDNAFNSLRANLESPGGNDTFVSMLIIMSQPRYGAAVPPSAVVNN